MLSSKRIAALVVASLATLTAAFPENGISVSRRTPTPFQAATPDQVTSNYLPLTRRTSTRPGLRSSLQRGFGLAPLQDLAFGQEFTVGVEFAGTEFEVILDTGSSDTWLVQEGFECVNAALYPESEPSCSFGPTFNGTFSEGQIANENFNITYGDLEFLTGALGYEEVTIAGITVKKQEIALVNRAYWYGDNITSGLVGLAYESITSAFKGTDPTLDNVNSTSSHIPYSPLFKTMYSTGLVGPMFSLAVERTASMNYDAPGGYVAFGGLPPVRWTLPLAKTPIEIHEFYRYPPQLATQRSFYTITPDAFVYGSSGQMAAEYPNAHEHANSCPAIVDSGTTLLYLPTEYANAVNALFDPPATFFPDEGAYFTACSATPPDFGVKIGGKVFYVNATDLIFPEITYTDPGTGETLCLTGIEDGGSGVDTFVVLGDVFLKNVVAVFDVGASEMRFAAHENY